MTILISLVAGMSSRFGGKSPKQLEKVGPNNETLIQYSIDQSLVNPIKKIIFITNNSSEQKFKNIFSNNYRGVPAYYIQQKYNKKYRNKPWGTMDAICCAVNMIDDNFIVINGDDIYGEETFRRGFNLLNKSRYNLLGLVKTIKTLPKSGKVNRGIVSTNGNYVKSLDEKLNISIQNLELHDTLANVNFLCFQPEIIFILKKYLLEFKEKNDDNPDIEVLLPNILNKMIENNEIILKYFEIESNILGITNPEDSAIIKKKLKSAE